jgi:hypothetical protein
VALLFATEDANKEGGLPKAKDRSPASTRICYSELYKIKLLLAEMTIQNNEQVPDKDSFPGTGEKEWDEGG